MLELLEPRALLTVSPLTLSDSSNWGDTAFGQSASASMSADGQLVVFESSASNLVPNSVLAPDGFNDSNVFVYNRATHETSLVSVDLNGNAAGGSHFLPPAVISPDGRYVAFASIAVLASNAPVGATNGAWYLRDLQTGQTTALGLMGISYAKCFFSADSNALFFDSRSTNLTNDVIENDPNSANPTVNLFRRELSTGATQLVSKSTFGSGVGVVATGETAATASADGRYVTFASLASTLTLGDTNSNVDVFVRDVVAGTTTLVSVSSAGVASGAGNSGYITPVISRDGTEVAFVSDAHNVVDGLTFEGAGSALYLRDLSANFTVAVSRRTDNTVPAGNAVSGVSLNDDGSAIAFADSATATTGLLDVVHYGVQGSDVYVYYPSADELHLASWNSGGTAAGNGNSGTVTLSAAADPDFVFVHTEVRLSDDGRFVFFTSGATDLISGAALSGQNVYRRDLINLTTELVSAAAGGNTSGNGESFSPAISANGRYVAFTSFASDLVVADDNLQDDVFVRDMNGGAVEAASRRSPLLPATMHCHSLARLRVPNLSLRNLAQHRLVTRPSIRRYPWLSRLSSKRKWRMSKTTTLKKPTVCSKWSWNRTHPTLPIFFN